MKSKAQGPYNYSVSEMQTHKIFKTNRVKDYDFIKKKDKKICKCY